MMKLNITFKNKILKIANKNNKLLIYLHKCMSKHNLYQNRINVYKSQFSDRENDMKLLLKYRNIYFHIWKILDQHTYEELKYIIVQYIDIKMLILKC